MGYIEWVTAITACLLSLISLTTIGTKKGRNFLNKVFNKHNKEIHDTNIKQNEEIKEIKEKIELISCQLMSLRKHSAQQCRNQIKDIYYKYYKEKKIPLFERKSADLIFDLYHTGFGGNSYAKLLYDEICKWEIDGQHTEKLIEEWDEKTVK